MSVRSKSKPRTSIEQFLRSVNIRLDAEAPDRLLHYRPTRRSAELLEVLAAEEGSESFLVTGPYGTGKSLVGALALHWVENRADSKELLREVGARLAIAHPRLAEATTKRARSKRHGLVVALHGYVPDLAAALQEAVYKSLTRIGAGRKAGGVRRRAIEDVADVLRLFEDLDTDAKGYGIDRVLVVWDEFGRHLEELVSRGRASELSDVQVLAEFFSRQENVSTRFAVVLHQNLQAYSARLPDSHRREWAQIEGRDHSLDPREAGT